MTQSLNLRQSWILLRTVFFENYGIMSLKSELFYVHVLHILERLKSKLSENQTKWLT